MSVKHLESVTHAFHWSSRVWDFPRFDPHNNRFNWASQRSRSTSCSEKNWFYLMYVAPLNGLETRCHINISSSSYYYLVVKIYACNKFRRYLGPRKYKAAGDMIMVTYWTGHRPGRCDGHRVVCDDQVKTSPHVISYACWLCDTLTVAVVVKHMIQACLGTTCLQHIAVQVTKDEESFPLKDKDSSIAPRWSKELILHCGSLYMALSTTRLAYLG